MTSGSRWPIGSRLNTNIDTWGVKCRTNQPMRRLKYCTKTSCFSCGLCACWPIIFLQCKTNTYSFRYNFSTYINTYLCTYVNIIILFLGGSKMNFWIGLCVHRKFDRWIWEKLLIKQNVIIFKDEICFKNHIITISNLAYVGSMMDYSLLK